MPRKNARPAAKKEAARRKARMTDKITPKRKVGIIAHDRPGGASLALLAVAFAHHSDKHN